MPSHTQRRQRVMDIPSPDAPLTPCISYARLVVPTSPCRFILSSFHRLFFLQIPSAPPPPAPAPASAPHHCPSHPISRNRPVAQTYQNPQSSTGSNSASPIAIAPSNRSKSFSPCGDVADDDDNDGDDGDEAPTLNTRIVRISARNLSTSALSASLVSPSVACESCSSRNLDSRFESSVSRCWTCFSLRSRKARCEARFWARRRCGARGRFVSCFFLFECGYDLMGCVGVAAGWRRRASGEWRNGEGGDWLNVRCPYLRLLVSLGWLLISCGGGLRIRGL